jgi:hypothetical protein
MASITFLRGASIAGTSYATGDTAAPSLGLALKLLGDGVARWSAAATVRPLPDLPDRVAVLGDVTALTGDAPAGLNGYLVAGIPAGRMFEVKLTAENRQRRYLVIPKDGETADGDAIIEPPDFDATDNNKYLLLIN